jgi:16S rRNA (cytidine1402-2'-O)-methyltransferase
MQKGKLYLIPCSLGNNDLDQTHSRKVYDIINKIDYYVAENINSAVKFLKLAGIKKRVQDLSFNVLNINSNLADISAYLNPADEGHNIGLITEAGVPCVADPGSELAAAAHERDIRVIPLAGPSSVIMALEASGLNGQNFAFNGYLPIDKKARKQKLRDLEKRIMHDNQTQIFIEAPHRNDNLLEELINNCSDTLRLSVAKNLTMDDELIITKKISEWKLSEIILGKNPAIFLIGK